MPEPPTMPRTALVMKLPYARNRVDLPAGRDRASDPPLSCSTLVLQLIHPRVNRSATEASTMSNSGVLDTRFRSALERMAVQGRLNAYTAPIDPHLEVAAVMKKLDGGPALLFSAVDGYDMPVVGNLLSCQANCEAAFGIDFNGIREFVSRALGSPQAPVLVEKGPAQEHIHTDDIDLARMLPALHHTAADAGRYVTAGIVIVRDPDTGTYNASYHRLQIVGSDRAAIKLDFGRHLRLAFERAKRKGEPLPIAVCIGSDLALHYTAATMGSQMPEHADEIAVAGGLCGRPLPVVKGVSQDLLIPADSEIVLEGRMLVDGTVLEGPFGEFVGYLSPADQAPVVEDIDIRGPHDVEYALATRMEASRDLVVMPAARGHEYIRVGQNGIRAKLGIDATIPFTEKSRFARCEFEKVSVDPTMLSADPQVIRTRLGL